MRLSLLGLILAAVTGPIFADYPVYVEESQGVIFNSPTMGGVLPGAVKCANGDLLVNFNTGKDMWPGSKVFLTRSTNNGITWEPAYEIVRSSISQDSGIHTIVGMTKLSNGDIILPYTEGELNPGWTGYPNPTHTLQKWMRAYVLISHDNGYTWSAPIYVAAKAVFGQVVEHNGKLLLPVWNWYKTEGIFDAASPGHSGFYESTDGGLTWQAYKEIGPFGETSMIKLANGSLMNAHKRNSGDPLQGFGVSRDAGQTWSEITHRHYGAGKSASLYMSLKGFPVIVYSQSGAGRSQLDFTLDEGRRWFKGVEPGPAISNSTNWTYGLTIVPLDADRFMIVYMAVDPMKTETSNAPWTSTTWYIGYSIIREEVRPGEPNYPAINDVQAVPDTPPVTVGVETAKPYAYPCPWRSDRHAGQPIRFGKLPPNSNVKIYTITAHLVTELSSDTWDLTNRHGERVASGVYLFLVTNNEGFKSTGKLVVIK
jgi:hypothetical protein